MIWQKECALHLKALHQHPNGFSFTVHPLNPGGARDPNNYYGVDYSFDCIGNLLSICPKTWIRRICLLMGANVPSSSARSLGSRVDLFFWMQLGRVYVGSVGVFLAFAYKRARTRKLCKCKADQCSMDRAKEHLSRISSARNKSTHPNLKYRQ